MTEQLPLVRQDLVQAPIQRVLLDQPIVTAEKVCHRTLLEPQSVQPPLAARINQPVADQRLKDVAPRGAFTGIGQPPRPELIEPELLVQHAGEPTGAPLPRPVQFHAIEPHLDAVSLGVIRNGPIGREQRQLCRLLRPFVKGFDNAAPRRALTVVDLAQVQNLPLHHFAPSTALALNDVPIEMLLAVLDPSVASQIHAADSTQNRTDEKPVSLHYTRSAPSDRCSDSHFCCSGRRKSVNQWPSRESRANRPSTTEARCQFIRLDRKTGFCCRKQLLLRLKV